MFKKIVGLASAALLFQESASAYEWQNQKHGCIVEHAHYLTTTTSKVGTWANSPKSFFVNVTGCQEYAEAKGVPLEQDVALKLFPDSDATYEEKRMVQRCAEEGTAFVGLYSVLELDGIPFNYLFPISRGDLSGRPFSNTAGMMVINEDGFIDFSSYGQMSDGETAWFTLKARCTVLDR